MTLDKTKLAQLKVRLQEMREEVQKEARQAFIEGTKDVFETFPQLHGFGWQQYTPYWNDGDVCIFSAHTWAPDLYVKISSIPGSKDQMPKPDDEITLDDGSEVAFYSGWEEPDEFRDIQKTVAWFLDALDDDDFLAMFGDHAEVVIFADGTQRVTEFDHE